MIINNIYLTIFIFYSCFILTNIEITFDLVFYEYIFNSIYNLLKSIFYSLYNKIIIRKNKFIILQNDTMEYKNKEILFYDKNSKIYNIKKVII